MQPGALAKVLILTAFAGWFLSLMLVPLVRWAACRVGLVDHPDPTRKLHRGQIALGGGIAVLLTTAIVAWVANFWFAPAFSLDALPWTGRWTGLACSSVAILLLGVADDRFNLRGKQKLLGQLVIVAAFSLAWAPSGQIMLFDWTFDLGALTLPILVLWLLVCINAVNLIDGADGAAGSFGLVASIGIAFTSFALGNVTVAVMAAALGASLAGFLCFNRPPASIFLGDAGSMLLGLVLGTLACWSVESTHQRQDILIPITLMGLPLFDSAVAILRRVLTGRSIYMADRGHLHHILGAHFKARSLSPMWMLIAFGGLTAITACGAIVGAVFHSDAFAVLAIGFVVLGLIWSRVFGHAEARLLASHTRRVGGSIVSKVRKGQQRAHVSGVALQGDRQWDVVWLPFVDFAEKNGLWLLKLDLNLPWQHEGYHGFWSRGEMPEKADQWSVKLPIICQRRIVGRLEVFGHAAGQSQLESLESFSYLMNEMQPEIERLVSCLSPQEQEVRPAEVGMLSDESSGQLSMSSAM